MGSEIRLERGEASHCARGLDVLVASLLGCVPPARLWDCLSVVSKFGCLPATSIVGCVPVPSDPPARMLGGDIGLPGCDFEDLARSWANTGFT